MHYGDLTDATNLIRLIQEHQPDEIYNLAAQSHVQVSFETPEYTANADALGTLRLLEAIRILGIKDKARFYQASTSELYGKVQEAPQRETTPFYPRSPYAAAKLYAYWITVNYREAYGMHASNGILFNHEGPMRGETFVTRKITRAVAAIERGLQERLYLGNLNAKRDWGHARDFVEGMWLMLQQPKPDDYVLATGETHSVREFVERAFACVGRTIEWRGKGVEEVGHRRQDRQGPGAHRSALLPADRGRRAAGRRHQGTSQTRLDAQDDVCRAGGRDGGERPRGRPTGGDGATTARPVRTSRRGPNGWQRLPRRESAHPTRSAGKRVWVAGHRGMVGAALVRRLAAEGCEILTADRGDARPHAPGRCRALDGARRGRRRCSSPPPRSAASSPTTATRPSSSTRT